jgi:hypothetical protein
VTDDLWRAVSAVTFRRFHLRRGVARSSALDATRTPDTSARWHALELSTPQGDVEVYWDGFASLSGALAWLEVEIHVPRDLAELRAARSLRLECPICEATRGHPCLRLSDRYTRTIYRGSGRSQDDWQRKRPHPERLARVDPLDASPIVVDPIDEQSPRRLRDDAPMPWSLRLPRRRS